jgi:uncharacterized protein YybS (DUF2232 family)
MVKQVFFGTYLVYLEEAVAVGWLNWTSYEWPFFSHILSHSVELEFLERFGLIVIIILMLFADNHSMDKSIPSEAHHFAPSLGFSFCGSLDIVRPDNLLILHD